MPSQLIFDLPVRTALGRDEYFVSPANALAVAAVEGWTDWPERKLALIGSKGSGKTHLVHVWAAEAKGRVVAASDLATTEIDALGSDGARLAVEDIGGIAGDAAAELALFHLHNLVLEEGGCLLLTGTSPPRQWALSLPDLASRMQATNIVQLPPPDDALLKAVLMKLFADRQLAVAPPVVNYLVNRMERSFDGAGRLVAALDRAALVKRRAVTIKLAAAVLDNGDGGTA